MNDDHGGMMGDEYDDCDEDFDQDDELDNDDPLADGGDDDDMPEDEAEDLFGVSVDTLMAERKPGGRKRRRNGGVRGAKRRPSDVPHTLKSKVGAAVIAYMSNKFDVAETLLLEVVQEAPKAVEPYKNLALICEERGDMRKSLEYLMFAAHADRQDRLLWKRCASLWYGVGDNDQAIYCLTMALKGTNGQDADALSARATVFESARQWRKAAENYVKLSKAEPDNVHIVVKISDMFVKDGKPLRAEPFLEKALTYFESNPFRSKDDDIFMQHERGLGTVIQRLVEVRFSQYRYEDAAKLLAHAQSRRRLGEVQPFIERVMQAVCQHRAGSKMLASFAFNEFFADKEVSNANPTVMWYIAEACFAGRDHSKTIKAYSGLVGHEDYARQPRLYLRRAEAHMQLGNAGAAEKDVRFALSLVPSSAEANAFLARIVQDKNAAKKKAAAAAAAAAAPTPPKQPAVKKPSKSDTLRTALRAAEQAIVVKEKSPAPRKPFVNYLLVLVREVNAASETALKNGGADQYLNMLAPPVEAALGLPEGYLRAHGNADLPTFGFSERALIERVQLIGEDLKALGQAYLRGLSDAQYVSFIELVLDHLIVRGVPGIGRNVVEVLAAVRGHRFQSAVKQVKIRVRIACLASIICDGDIVRAYEDMRVLAREFPDDTRIWWLHAQFDAYLNSLRTSTFRSRMVVSLTRDAKKEFRQPSEGGACIGAAMACGVFSVRGRGQMITPRPAVRCFAFVHRRVPGVPSAALGTAINLLSMARSRSAVNREHLLLKAFTYLDEYRRLRRSEVAGMASCARAFVENEVAYNTARSFHDVGLLHMAADGYRVVLGGARAGARAAEARAAADGGDTDGARALAALPAWLNVQREAAYNLAHILASTGQTELAGALVRQHLVF